MRRPALVLLSVFFPSFDLLLYYNTKAALGNTTRTLTRTPDHHAYTHAHRRTYAHTHTHTHIHASKRTHGGRRTRRSLRRSHRVRTN